MMAELGTRSNVVVSETETEEECPLSPIEGEVIIAPDGRWLGGFDSVNVVPFGLEYPAGWTPGTWYEQPARGAEDDPTCDCMDCEGLHPGRRARQRLPDEEITCDEATLFDFWDHAIHPKKFLGGSICITNFDPGATCIDGGGKAYAGNCDVDPASSPGNDAPYGWPLCGFAFLNPASRLRVVTDNSGPEGCEDALAMEIDFSGSGLEGACFIGDHGGHTGDSPPNGYADGSRSTTGWTISENSCWVTRFWIKAVPDNDGYVCAGYPIRTRAGFWPFPFAETTIDGSPVLTVTADWQEFYQVWFAQGWLNPMAFPEPMLNAPFGIFTTESNSVSPACPEGRPFIARKGRVHVKQVHVYPCEFDDGIWIKRPSGLRT